MLKTINPDLGVKGPWTTKHVTEKFPPVLKTIKVHFVNEKYYFNAIFKCIPGSEDHCGVCGDVTSSVGFSTKLRTTMLLPDPTPDPNRPGKFAPYERCATNGLNTTQTYTPSLVSREKTSLTGVNSQTARGFAVCVTCDKPRVYYSKKKLSTSENKSLNIALDSLDFECGSALINDSHPNSGVAALFVKVAINTGLTCSNHVEWPYYSKSGSQFPIVCCWCGGSLSANDLEERQEQLSVVSTCIPRCANNSCVQKGWQTRRKKIAFAKKETLKTKKKTRISSQKAQASKNKRKKKKHKRSHEKRRRSDILCWK